MIYCNMIVCGRFIRESRNIIISFKKTLGNFEALCQFSLLLQLHWKRSLGYQFIWII